MDATPKPQEAINPPPQAIDDKDLEAGARLRRTPSRVSVPLSRRSSQNLDDYHGDNQTQNGDAEDGEEYEWGPSHPCFPHMNPHVPLSSPLYQTTRIIRIRRDWMVAGDLAPTFANLYPEVLDPMLSEDTFRQVIRKINDTLLEAFSPWSGRAWLDAILGVATLWMWDDMGLTAVKSKLRELESWIENWNKNIGEPEGVQIIPLRRTGYLTVCSLHPSSCPSVLTCIQVDIQIPDPQIEAGRPDTRTTNPPPADGIHLAQTESQRNSVPQIHADFAPFPMTDLGTMRQNGQQHLTSAIAA